MTISMAQELLRASPNPVNLLVVTSQVGLSQNHSLFNKLSNPVEKMLNLLTVSDGLDINNLLYFLNGLVKFRNQTNLRQCDLY